MTKDERIFLILALLVAAWWFFFRKAPASASTVRHGQVGNGCGCNSGTVSPAQQTAPPNPQSTFNRPVLTTNRWGRAASDHSGRAAPGGNSQAAGGGQNYQGVGAVNYSPSVPAGNSVWQANATPVRVATR